MARFKASRTSRSAAVAEEWTDAASRSDQRYEIKFPLREPYTDPGFTTNRYLLNFAKCMLTTRCSGVRARRGEGELRFVSPSHGRNCPTDRIPKDGD